MPALGKVGLTERYGNTLQSLQGIISWSVCSAFMGLRYQKHPAMDTGHALFPGGSEIDDIRNVAHIAVGKKLPAVRRALLFSEKLYETAGAI